MTQVTMAERVMNKRPKLSALLAQLEAAAILHEATGQQLERLRIEIQRLAEATEWAQVESARREVKE